MKVIWKYALEIDDLVSLNMPIGAKILSVQRELRHNGFPVVWVLCDTEAAYEIRQFRIVGTGHNHPHKYFTHLKYISTVQTSLSLVWHIFEVIK